MFGKSLRVRRQGVDGLAEHFTGPGAACAKTHPGLASAKPVSLQRSPSMVSRASLENVLERRRFRGFLRLLRGGKRALSEMDNRPIGLVAWFARDSEAGGETAWRHRYDLNVDGDAL